MLLLSVFAAFVTPAMATRSSDGATNEIVVGASNPVLIGQTLGFIGDDTDKQIIGKTPEAITGLVYGTTSGSFDSIVFTL